MLVSRMLTAIATSQPKKAAPRFNPPNLSRRASSAAAWSVLRSMVWLPVDSSSRRSSVIVSSFCLVVLERRNMMASSRLRASRSGKKYPRAALPCKTPLTGDVMRVSKQQVVEFIRERGDEDRADRAESELPDHLDLPADEAKLLGYGVSPIDLAGDEPDHGGASPRGESGEAAE